VKTKKRGNGGGPPPEIHGKERNHLVGKKKKKEEKRGEGVGHPILQGGQCKKTEKGTMVQKTQRRIREGGGERNWVIEPRVAEKILWRKWWGKKTKKKEGSHRLANGGENKLVDKAVFFYGEETGLFTLTNEECCPIERGTPTSQGRTSTLL